MGGISRRLALSKGHMTSLPPSLSPASVSWADGYLFGLCLVWKDAVGIAHAACSCQELQGKTCLKVAGVDDM